MDTKERELDLDDAGDLEQELEDVARSGGRSSVWFARLNRALEEASKPGMAGVLALRKAQVIVGELELAVDTLEMVADTKAAARYAVMLRQMGGATEILAAKAAAVKAHPELWAGTYEEHANKLSQRREQMETTVKGSKYE